MDDQNKGNASGGQSKSDQLNYSIPGILHFIQHEWTRFEMERAHWDVERAELQARIAFLNGERKGQENLKKDLVRRIKMLEYALKQERVKNQKGPKQDVPLPDDLDGEDGDEEDVPDPYDELSLDNAVSLKQGRNLLRKYLHEVGYTDTILDIRASRINSLLGLTGGSSNDAPAFLSAKSPGGNRSAGDYKLGDFEDQLNQGTVSGSRNMDSMSDRNFEKNLYEKEVYDNDDRQEGDNDVDSFGRLEELGEGGEYDVDLDDMNPSDIEGLFRNIEGSSATDDVSGGGGNDVTMTEDGEAAGGEDAWSAAKANIDKKKEEYKKERNIKKQQPRPKKSALEQMMKNLAVGEDDPNFAAAAASANQGSGANSGDEPGRRGEPGGLSQEQPSAILGELAGLTISNEADPLHFDLSTSIRDDYRKTWNIKYTLRSHFDSVRCVAFHPSEQVVVTGSDDHTLKLWNLAKAGGQAGGGGGKKAASPDMEPIYTFRGHVGKVLGVAVAPLGDKMYSCGVDGTVQGWTIPPPSTDPYEPYETSISLGVVCEHEDSVWEVAHHASRPLLMSASADATVKLWDTAAAAATAAGADAAAAASGRAFLSALEISPEDGSPVTCNFVPTDHNQAIVGFSSSNAALYDIETGKLITRFVCNSDNVPTSSKQVNKIISHPTSATTISAHEDKYLRFFDNVSGKMTSQMVAHLDAITSLATDPNGLYLLSGSHDCSIRLWSLDSKTCVQEIAAHRQKYDESIYDVAFHPNKELFASAGADALAKIFV